jgi:hypothetical protein
MCVPGAGKAEDLILGLPHRLAHPYASVYVYAFDGALY